MVLSMKERKDCFMSPNSNKQHANRSAQVTQSHINKAWIRRHGIEGLVIAFVLLMSLSVFGCGRRTVNPNDKDVLTAYSIGKDAEDLHYDINKFELKYGGKKMKVKGTVALKESGELWIYSNWFHVSCRPRDLSQYVTYDRGDRVIFEGYGHAVDDFVFFKLHFNMCQVHPIKYETPELIISISDLSKIQSHNLEQFRNKYMGKYLRIHGSVYEMNPDTGETILKNADGYRLVGYCKSIANSFSVGDYVEVEGEIVSMDENNARLGSCKINKSNSQPMQQATERPTQSATDVQKITDQPVDNAPTQMIEKQKAELKRENLYDLNDGFVPNAKVEEQVANNQKDSNKGKRCNVQTISNEKRIPKWSIEIIDSSIVASMLKDAEKSHLPFLKINASDDLEQKLVAYINKNPTRINPNSQEAFTCRIGNNNKTASGIGVQHVLCDDSDVSVSFLNLVSPVDKKARIYKVKTFDHLFEDSPVVEKIEESVINGERGVYVAVKYEDFSDGTGTEYIETDFVNYLFLGDKLRYLTDWNAFHIEEHHHYDDDGALEYSCNAKATVLRLEGSEAKYREHSFSIQ